MDAKTRRLLVLLTLLVASCSPPTAQESEIRNATNEYRAGYGLTQEGLSYNLQTDARNWANRMAYTQNLEHSDLFQLLYKYPSLSICGENLFSASGAVSSIVIVNAWKTSPPHDANLLNPQFTMTGVGVAYDAQGGQWVDAMYCG